MKLLRSTPRVSRRFAASTRSIFGNAQHDDEEKSGLYDDDYYYYYGWRTSILEKVRSGVFVIFFDCVGCGEVVPTQPLDEKYSCY